MHELGLAVHILEVIERHLPPDRQVQVKTIRIRAGKLTAVYPPALETCLEAVGRNTPVQGATLVVAHEPIRARCRDCQAVSELDEPPFACAKCGQTQLDIISGRELFVESIEVEEVGNFGLRS